MDDVPAVRRFLSCRSLIGDVKLVGDAKLIGDCLRLISLCVARQPSCYKKIAQEAYQTVLPLALDAASSNVDQ